MIAVETAAAAIPGALAPRPVFSLTPRQAELLACLERYQEDHGAGAWPGYRLLAGMVGGRGRAHELICALEERGRIRVVLKPGRVGWSRRPAFLHIVAPLPRPVTSRSPDGAPLFFVPAPGAC